MKGNGMWYKGCTQQYNLNDPEDFRQLETLAYNGTATLDELPAPAYKYFSRLEKVGVLYKRCQITLSELQQRRTRLLKEYEDDLKEYKLYREVCCEYQGNIKAAQAYYVAIEQATTAEIIAELACRYIEVTTGEVGFAKRQMRKIRR